MITVNKFFKILLCFWFLYAGGMTGIYAQKKQAEIKKMIEAREFMFIPQTALPMTGATRQVTPDFNLKISPTAVVSYLPYFGRAYNLTYGSTQSPLDFSSAKFEYTMKNGKKGGWEIDIKPKDVTSVRELTLTISANGYGNLQVASEDRQPISFTGYISAVR